jgi:hypothetical protein
MDSPESFPSKAPPSSLPGHCPVTPLGQFVDRDCDHFYAYKSALVYLVALSAEQHSRCRIFGLFAGKSFWLCRHFPLQPHAGEAVDWDYEAVVDALFKVNDAIGPVDPWDIGFRLEPRLKRKWVPADEVRR